MRLGLRVGVGWGSGPGRVAKDLMGGLAPELLETKQALGGGESVERGALMPHGARL